MSWDDLIGFLRLRGQYVKSITWKQREKKGENLRERERERETERERDREREKKKKRETERDRERERESDRERDRERQRKEQREKKTDRLLFITQNLHNILYSISYFFCTYKHICIVGLAIYLWHLRPVRASLSTFLSQLDAFHRTCCTV